MKNYALISYQACQHKLSSTYFSSYHAYIAQLFIIQKYFFYFFLIKKNIF